MKIFIVRHGQTDWNLEQRLQGSIDIPLNETGRSQARALRDRIKNMKFDICYCSTLFRAAETAQILTGHRDADFQPLCAIRYDARLRERGFGQEEGRTDEEIDLNFFYNVSWDMEINSSKYGVEPILDFYRRAKSFCDNEIPKIRAEFGDDASVLLVTHGGMSRMLNYVLLGGTEKPDKNSEAWQKTQIFRLRNCDLFEYEI